MAEPTWTLSDDRTTLTIAFPSNPPIALVLRRRPGGRTFAQCRTVSRRNGASRDADGMAAWSNGTGRPRSCMDLRA